MDKIIRTAVIGAGITGVSAVNHIVQDTRYNENIHIDIFDSKSRFGKGRPYQQDSDSLLLNIPADEMSASQNDTDFKDWLARAGYVYQTFSSRRKFGEYTSELLDSIIKKYKNVQQIHSNIEEVTFEPNEQLYTLYFGDREEKYDYVFLVIGQLDYSDPYNLIGQSGYIHDPYPVEQTLHHIKGEIGILGSGLSAIDCVRYLLMERREEKVHIFSRSGEMPSVRGNSFDITPVYFTPENLDRMTVNDEIPLEEIIDLFIKEMETQHIDSSLFYRRSGDTLKDLKYDLAHPDEIGRLQYLIIRLNPIFSDIFLKLSRSDKSRFMDQYHPLIDENHSPMPRRVAEELVRWIETGRINVVDDISNIEKKDKFLVRDDHRLYTMDTIINATGPVKRISKDDHGIIAALREHFIIGEDSFGGILVSDSHNVISPKFGTLNNMYALGHLTFGADYMANTVKLLVRNTAKLSNQFFLQLNSKK